MSAWLRRLGRAGLAAFLGLCASPATSHSQTETTFFVFSKLRQGTEPLRGLTEFDGLLYGVASGGGRACAAPGCGTVFSIDSSGAERVLHDFKGAPDGWAPNAQLVVLDGKLYGTTYIGGNGSDCDECGTVFEVGPDGRESVLHSFQGGTDGMLPFSGLAVFQGSLYGTTPVGGAPGLGVVYKVSPEGEETVVYAFRGGPDGAGSYASLIVADGALYGTTELGGTGPCRGASGTVVGCGTVFRIAKDGSESVVYSFQGGTDGSFPVANLTYAEGRLYGTTEEGGSAANAGVVFSLSLGGTETVLHAFQGHFDGASPQAGPTPVRGELYGVTEAGGGLKCGGGGCGTLFSISRTGAETVLHVFRGGDDGRSPVGSLLDEDGVLYGTTSEGGGSPACAGGCGTVFRLIPQG